MAELTGTVFNIQRFSTEDGPGIRTTVFLKGCPLRCLWCANPESQLPLPQVAHRDSKCRGCGTCVQTCPNHAISLTAPDGGAVHPVIDRDRCVSCGACVSACTAGALHIYGETKTVDEVFAVVKRDAGYYASSGGGLTVSGGEAMMQADFTAALFARCRRLGIPTALDTCGCCPTEEIDKLDGLVDLVLFDLKFMDSAAHRQYVGAGNELILRNLERFHQTDAAIFIRIPLIPDINDTEENLRATAEFVRSFDPSLHIDLLPYHNYGINKFAALDRPYTLADIKRQSPEKLAACKAIFDAYGLDCELH